MTDHAPLIVSRFDVAMEPAIEEEQILTIAAIAEDGRPVALLLDPETRAKVARWLGPDRAEILAEAAKVAVRAARDCGDSEAGQYAASVAAGIGKELRRMARTAGQGEKDTAPAATSTPQLAEHIGRLYDHILSHGGTWTASSARRWLRNHVDPNTTQHAARHALQHLAGIGYLTEHDVPGRRTYTPNYAKDGNR
jgi:hypothetical protein